MPIITKDLEYIIIFSLVLLLPKLFLKFRIPTGITALAIGVLFSIIDPNLGDDALFRFLSQIGITSLFLFAGMEVDFKELKDDRVYLGKYLAKALIALLGLAFVFNALNMDSFQNSLIFALGLLTPSAGFIMTSLHSYKIQEDQEYWVKSKAISKEILAVFLLFFALAGSDVKTLSISMGFFVGLFLLLPLILKAFFKFILPNAPNTEVPFLVVIALFCGVISKELGTYYLVGAFIVGLVCSKLKHEIFTDREQQMFLSLSSFFNVFLPFYFFYAGIRLNLSDFTWQAGALGLGLAVIFVPLRILLIRSSVTSLYDKSEPKNFHISLSLMPTLIFGLVIAGILKTRGVDPVILYALVFYTLLTSLLPTVFFSYRSRKGLEKTGSTP